MNTSKREPRVGDIWIMRFPYHTPGSMEKVRPGIIIDFKDDFKVVVQKLTTKKKKGNKLFTHPKLKKVTYLSTDKEVIYEDSLIRYIGNNNNRKVI